MDFRSQNPHVGPLWCCYCRAEWVRELCGCDDVAPEVEIESTSEEVDPPSERAVEIEPADEEAPGVYTALPGVSEQLEGDPVDAYTLGPSLEASEPWSSVSESSDAQGHGVFYYLLRPWRIVDRVRASSIAEWLRGRWIRSRLFRVLLWLFERSIVE